MRKLASIQRIRALDPIPEADAILRATVLGWELVVKKDEFALNDLCVYAEIDSLMPDRPEFEFLKSRGMRIKTIRLRGQISQGICLPLSILPEGTAIEEGADVTDILGITKYDPPMPANLAGQAKGLFPSFLSKTDETRVQVLQDLLDKYAGEPCYVAEKLDGSCVTYYIKDGVFGVCSRNLDLLETDDNSLWKCARSLDIETKLLGLNKNFALQGEIIGEGIQSNKYKLKGQSVRFFNAFEIDTHRYVDFPNFTALMETLELETVPILERNYILEREIPILVEKAAGKSVLYKDTHREGIVIRPLVEQIERNFGRVSFKAINPAFLLKYGE
jgi:RNA ligase (TIGR02306 family)